MKDFHSELFANTTPSLTVSSPLGAKPTNLESRQVESKRLSLLMDQKRPFCFLRMGDMDLSYLIASQQGRLNEVQYGEQLVSGTLAAGNPGIGEQYVTRLKKAFLEGDYVDFHERLYPMEHWLPLLHLPRAAHLDRNPNRETSYLSLTWLEYEFQEYCQGRRVGIVGAEARLLELLTKQSIWQEVAKPWWPSKSQIYFHQVREDGRNLDKNLDLIKKDLAEFIKENQLDTLFISLGGGAKILCYELSREHNICTFDFGAMIRALTYSACDGNRANRSTHSPFLFRVPFSIFMEALQQTFPYLTEEELFAKTHAQLLLEIQHKEIGWTHTAWEYDLSQENKLYFHQAYQVYLKRYKHLRDTSLINRREFKNFLYFCGLHRLTTEGIIYYNLVQIKSMLNNLINHFGKLFP